MVKNPREIESMRQAGRSVGRIRDELSRAVAPGVTTRDLDDLARELIGKAGGTSPFYQYRQRGKPAFPGHICASVNEEVVHGIGSGRRLQYGDIVKLDIGLKLNGWIGDTAITIPVGVVSEEVQKLLEVTERSLYAAVQVARAGNQVGDIGHAVETVVRQAGFSVVRDFVGHGVGRTLHEEPQIPNYGNPRTGKKLKPGMTLAIEPMVNMGRPEVEELADQWTVATVDRKPSAHFEHTVLVTEGQPEILTWSEAISSRWKALSAA
ncbi:MAG: type I methionyl aminopeptidase [Verrucomicrobiae bacterium]|nr:type I methionyl aminopeptidase [Verrucomicrobiae bacterium]